MAPGEAAAFLREGRTMICATNGPGGWPHLMPLWYVVRPAEDPAGAAPDGVELWAWTYGKSQKVRNLERDPRTTIQVEAGEEYGELRGVMIEAQAILHGEPETVSGVGAELARRYGGVELTGEALAALSAQALKRVALQFVAQRVVSWDHRKLGAGA